MTTQLPNEFVGTSLSSGTMREIDLYSAFMPFLAQHDPKTVEYLDEEYKHVIGVLSETNNTDYIDDNTQDELNWLIESLFDVLNDIAPEDTYFGAHPGDGSDYGFWYSEENYALESE